jgi:glycosyltransferase involved in cell wall biosynthesis
VKVLEIAPRYAPAVGGTETHVKEVATRLADMGVEVVVLTTDTSGELPSQEIRDGVVVERVRAWPRSRDYYLAPGLLPRLLRRDYDVAHCQSYQTLVPLVAMAALLLAHKPYVVTTH